VVALKVRVSRWRCLSPPCAKRKGRTYGTILDLERHTVTGAIVEVTLQGADEGDTTSMVATATAAAEQIEGAQAEVKEPQPLEEIIADKGYHGLLG